MANVLAAVDASSPRGWSCCGISSRAELTLTPPTRRADIDVVPKSPAQSVSPRACESEGHGSAGDDPPRGRRRGIWPLVISRAAAVYGVLAAFVAFFGVDACGEGCDQGTRNAQTAAAVVALVAFLASPLMELAHMRSHRIGRWWPAAIALGAAATGVWVVLNRSGDH